MRKCFNPLINNLLIINGLKTRCIHKTSINLDVMEFFDDKKNWGENEIKTGIN